MDEISSLLRSTHYYNNTTYTPAADHTTIVARNFEEFRIRHPAMHTFVVVGVGLLIGFIFLIIISKCGKTPHGSRSGPPRAGMSSGHVYGGGGGGGGWGGHVMNSLATTTTTTTRTANARQPRLNPDQTQSSRVYSPGRSGGHGRAASTVPEVTRPEPVARAASTRGGEERRDGTETPPPPYVPDPAPPKYGA
ncbi:hypothetical protein DHEL01_v205722 [Diaporthe helianthi]|uniref:Uncharacterized protein n=1 Tax=Diaporthe helianthi TaxID=158607 RepID=A0A2P5I033_DIAHE|nr:hypothetical protein DHEL01_v205722 [Diaporthe helianthi]